MANEDTWIGTGNNNFAAEFEGLAWTSGYLEIGRNDPGSGYRDVNGAIRFTNIDVAQGTTVNWGSLYIYCALRGTSGGGNLKFDTYGIDEDNTADFSSNPFGRTKTTASDSADNPIPALGKYKQVTVTSIVNEILGRGGWSSGNAMGFLMIQNAMNDGDWIYDSSSGTNSYLAIRVNAEPDFTPAVTTISAPSFPAAEDWGVKISQPGTNVFDASETQLYFTTRKKQFKVSAEGQLVTSSNPENIAHGLSYIPFAEVFVKSGSNWFRLPYRNFSGGSNIGYMEVDGTNVKIYTAVSSTIYYYIFVDQLFT